MIVGDKYELLEAVQEDGVRTYRGRHVKLGRTVLVHFIPETVPGDAFALLDKLAALSETDRLLFIDAGERGSEPYLVSWELPGFDNLLGWLDRATRKLPEQPPAVRAQPAAGPVTARAGGTTGKLEDSSEFTRMFFTGLREPSRASQPGPPAPPPPPQAPPPAGRPGEFTQFFGAAPGMAKEPQPGVTPPATVRPPATSTPAPGRPGEFTEFFGGAQGKPKDPHRTEILHKAVVIGPPSITKPPPPPRPDWQNDVLPPPVRPEPQSPPETSRHPDWLDEPLPRPANPPRQAEPQGPPRPDWLENVPVLPRSGAGPSRGNIPPGNMDLDYTKVIAPRPPIPPVSVPPPPDPAAVPPLSRARPLNLVPLWIGLGALGTLAVILIVIFVLRG
jgi:hypothetical protein